MGAAAPRVRSRPAGGGGEDTGGAGPAEHPRWRETWPRLQLIVARTEARKAVSVASLSPGTALGGRLA
jgi:hypothetical protein